MARLKIALVTMQLGPEYPHGTERYVESLGSELRARGHEVLFIAGHPKDAEERPFGAPRDIGGTLTGLCHHPTTGWLTVRGPVEAARGWLEHERPDVVHLANPAQIGVALALAAERLGIPVVATAMDFWWTCPRATLLRDGAARCDGTPGWRDCLRCVSSDHARRTLRPLARMPDALADVSLAIYGAATVLRRGQRAEGSVWKHRREELTGVLNRMDAIIFPSPATRDVIAPLLSHDRFELVPYGLAPEWFEDPRPERAAGAGPGTPDELTLGYAGSLQQHKGPHLLLEAVRKLGWRQTRIRLAGEIDTQTAYGRRLEQQAQGLNVEFTGLLDQPEMRAFHRSLDVLAITSTWPENLPFVMLEALAAGVTVVASNVDGISHQIANERLLFEAGDSTALAEALRAACAGPILSPAPQPVLTLSEMVDATVAIYERATDRHSAELARG